MRGDAGYAVRVKYSKQGKVRWISHRDVARAFERALRIEQLPLAFTLGFSPRPKVSFGLALSTGYESEAEYLDLELSEPVDLEPLPERLNAAMPIGLSVIDVVALADRAPALQEVVTVVTWRVEVTGDDGEPVPVDLLSELVAAARSAAVLEVEQVRKGRASMSDVRPAIRSLDVVDGEVANIPTLEMELSTQPRGAKPSEVVAAIAGTRPDPPTLAIGRAVRTHQWIERDGARCEPLDADTRPHVPVVRAS
ncbi:MAG TPA: TIGR03936 family radical SAM-associated protein [Acidimicrobiia bacterium]|jgi:radical SAM-linked protein|nr:TIGR03936 family radical SAM-associated protein [Acidimicrobiia bacterium]